MPETQKPMKKTSRLGEDGPPWSDCGPHYGLWPPPWLDYGGY